MTSEFSRQFLREDNMSAEKDRHTPTSGPATSASLLERLRASTQLTREDWQQFMGLYAGFLYECARRLGGRLHLSEEECLELAHEMLVYLVRVLKDFEYQPTKGHFRHWLKKVLSNFWLSFQRKKRVYLALQENLQAQSDLKNYIEQTHCTEIVSRALKLAQQHFDRTDPRVYEAFRLVQLEGKVPAEVATSLGKKVGWVYQATFRVRRYLHEILEGQVSPGN